MNQKQRDFLTTTIKDTCAVKVRALNDLIGEEPILDNFIMAAIFGGTFKVLPSEEIAARITKRIVESNGKQRLSEDDRYSSKRINWLKVLAQELIEMPVEYMALLNAWKERKLRIEEEVRRLNSQKDNLILRVNLASDSTLDSLTKDIDAMGQVDINSTVLLGESNHQNLLT